MTQSLWYQGGTLVLDDVEQAAEVHRAFQWIKAKWRCEAYHYADVLPWLRERGVRDTVPHSVIAK